MKTKALISFAVTAKLICAFVSAYADVGFPMRRPIYQLHVTSMKFFVIGNKDVAILFCHATERNKTKEHKVFSKCAQYVLSSIYQS